MRKPCPGSIQGKGRDVFSLSGWDRAVMAGARTTILDHELALAMEASHHRAAKYKKPGSQKLGHTCPCLYILGFF